MRLLLLTLTLLLLVAPARAQATLVLAYDTPVEGRLDAATPRAVYTFDGLRGEVLDIALEVLDGGLDPTVLVLDSAGTVLAYADDGVRRGATLNSLRLPASDVYTVVVARFGGELGSTSGRYRLLVTRQGVSSASGSALRYGDSVISALSDDQPQAYYTFQAAAGDVVNVVMRRVSGNLDPYLLLVDASEAVIAENDDFPGLAPLDAALWATVIPADGTYVVIATRYGGPAPGTAGTFVLSLEAASQGGGLGASAIAPAALVAGITVQGELTNERHARYYVFQATRDARYRIGMERAGGTLDSYLRLLDADGRELAADDDSGGGQNALIASFRAPSDGPVTVVATRYEFARGTSTGAYTLTLTELSAAALAALPEGTTRLRYGSTVTGEVTPDVAEVLYAFEGARGDVVRVDMIRTSGNLDPFVILADAAGRALVRDDDSGGNRNARIDRYTLPADGVYLVRAGRYIGPEGDSTTTGSFALTLARTN